MTIGPETEASKSAKSPGSRGIRSDRVVLKARGLTKRYHSGDVEILALRGADLDLCAEELVVLLGPSGSGKSTLLNIIGGLDTPSEGTVSVNGTEISRMDESQLTRFRRNHVGFVFQFYNLVPSLTAQENVALATEIAPDPIPPREALAMVGLAERTSHFPAQLSGGEQQRVAIARAIAKRPEILLCDEPTGALDSHTGVVVLQAIERFNREFGTTTILITHNAGIGGMADRVIRLADGQIAETHINTEKLEAGSISW